jgi:D-3-phosphoglycerate dehydrogenase
MAQHRILITGALHTDAMTRFRNHSGFEVVYLPDCQRQELLEQVATADVLVSRSETDVDREVIDHAKRLRVIARAAVGVGNIDIDYATEKGMLVINCPGKNTNSAAELSLGLMLALLRKIPDAQNKVKSGGWDRHRFSGRELRGKTIGIVGLGNVGHRVAKFSNGFDMEVLAFDPYIAPEVFIRNGARRVETLAELLPQVDILTVHVPLNRETKGMIAASELALLRRGSFVINAARGGIIHEGDLLAALDSGHVSGAGIDTFDHEPKPMPQLIQHPQLCCTPHIGASTDEAQIAIGITVFDQVCKALEGGVVDYPVNLPDIGLSDSPLLKPYAVLAQKLGSVVGQMIDFNPTQIDVSYRGDLAGLDTKIVRLSFIKGYASHVSDQYISLVNAQAFVEKIGVKITELSDPDFSSYKSAFKVIVWGANQQRLSIGGIVFDGVYPRISLVNDFYFEIDPTGRLLLMENNDRPGVIGDVGHFLASQSINIDHFSLSRNRKGGNAMAVIRTDSTPTSEQLKAMGSIKNVASVKLISL